eukprot:CAMPEP_0202809952 /NCGR_PEP_ID=MMETSP1389-20130828/2158_1 /ASSEMBLY_ACC=CAM_ASM_000865 /TAXON_ID=302021 /ORGANISM="Rhodomonas sp., Strain CCMP768" /LENGTH=361 /DNA_ID=CAMNT_0049480707 /DNA_START=10 /DNA_END=1095 /DNA_ORIENTATION=+
MKEGGLLLLFCAALLLQTDAFIPQLRMPTKALAPSISRTCRGLPSLRMGYLDDLAPKKSTASPSSNQGGSGGLMPDADYTGFIDAEDGFDGGDGQVGVVGDGDNAMEKFDNREIVDNTVGGRGKVSGGTKDSRIDKRWNAWGADETDTEFQQDLINRGVVEIDQETGEDLRKVQRQQYENWFKQRKTWANEKAMRDAMEAVGGEKRQSHSDDYKSFLDTGKTEADPDNSNVIFATGAKGIDNSEILKKTDWKPCVAGTRIDGEFEVRGSGLVTIPVEANSMVSEQFIARFTDDSPSTFVVAENAWDLGDRMVMGEMPRRGQDKEFTVRFTPDGPLAQAQCATLVIDQEDGFKWTFKITGST